MEKNKNNSKNLLIIIIILIFIIAWLLLFISYDKGIIFKAKDMNKNSEEITNAEEKNKEETESEITDQTLKQSLIEKITYKDKFKVYTSNNIYTFRYGTTFGNVFTDFNNEIKLHVLLTYLNETGKFHPISDANKTNNLINSYINNGMEVREITADEVSHQYQLFYGESIPSYQAVGNNCFRFEYDNDIKTFFWTTPTCGGTGIGLVYSYINKFVNYKEDAYVYVNFATSEPIDMTNYSIYKGFSANEIYQSNVSMDYVKKFKIDASNYQNFSEYKFIFKKDTNGNYYFSKLEKNKS